MAKPFAARTLKVMDYFRKHPDASVATVAGKFNMAMSQTYALRKRVRDEGPELWQPPALLPAPEVSRPIVNPEIGMEPKPAGRKVTVSASQIGIARAMGVPLDEYVKEGLKQGVFKYDDEVTMEPDETDVDAVLDSRAKDYGKFIEGAEIMQMLKRLVHNYIEDRQTPLAFDQREAIDMIIHKMGRILNGNPDKVDHWVDIAGYAKLVADRLEGNAR
jgi:hypothetical protein